MAHPLRRLSALPPAMAVMGMCLGFVAASAHAGEADRELRLAVDYPPQQAVVGSEDGRVFVSGRALSAAGTAGRYDVIVVIDTSFSTMAPSGADVDGDGKRGRRLIPFLSWLLPIGNSDEDDSVLAAEIEAARTLLDQLDPQTTRVGVVAFAGDARTRSRDAHTRVPLTSNYAKVRRGLDRLQAEGPHGRTNIYDAVSLAATELSGSLDAISDAREDSRKLVLFMTDGHPTLPIPHAPSQNARLAIGAAHHAATLGVRIDTFAIGKSATDQPRVTVEMAAVTDGVFTPVRDPKDLIAVFQDIDLARLSDLQVRNATTGQPAEHVIVESDGTFSALVELRDGTNTLEVAARASDGTRDRVRVEVRRLPGRRGPLMSARLQERRTRLLENRLADLQERNLEMETERREQLRRELALEIESARSEAKRNSRSVRIDVSDPRPPASPARGQ